MASTSPSGGFSLGSNPSTPTMKSRGQMQIVFGIAVILVIVGAVLGFQWWGDGGSEEDESSELPETSEPISGAVSDAAPMRSNLFPTGTLPAGTTQTKISVSINKPGYCRHSTKSGQSYDSMRERFSTDKDKTFHSDTIKSLKNGQTYTYYVRCKDLAGNRNASDAIIQFTIGGSSPYTGSGGYTGSSSGADTTPPQRINLFPTGTLPAGTIETQISVSTNEPGYCRYSTEAGQSYSSMRERFSSYQSKTLHTDTVKGLTDNKIFEYYVRCRDLKGNKNTSDAQIRFGVGGASLPFSPIEPGQDAIPPYRFAPSPDDEDLPYTTKKVIISLKTDEKAVCRYGMVSGLSYYSMNRIFTNTNSTYHSTEVTGLSEGGEYKYYIKCADENENVNTDDFIVSFIVEEPEDFTPPVRRNPYPTGDVLSAGTTQTIISITTNEPGYCRYNTEQGTSYKSMRKSLKGDSAKQYHTATVTGLENGNSYSYFVRCKDLEGNANTGDVMIYFSVGE